MPLDHSAPARPPLFSLIHPSRQRIRRAEEAAVEWSSKASGRHQIEHILSIDDSDPDGEGYRQLAQRCGLELCVGPNRNYVEAVNRGAATSRGEILIVIADDFGCPESWDSALAEVIGERRDLAVLIDDDIQGRIMTLPIIGRQLYEKLGFVYYPAYRSMYCDDDITETARHLDKLVTARHLAFPHRHFSVGRSELDETYQVQNAPDAYVLGRYVLRKRQALGFDIAPPTLRQRLAAARLDCEYRLLLAARKAKSYLRTLAGR